MNIAHACSTRRSLCKLWKSIIMHDVDTLRAECARHGVDSELVLCLHYYSHIKKLTLYHLGRDGGGRTSRTLVSFVSNSTWLGGWGWEDF